MNQRKVEMDAIEEKQEKEILELSEESDLLTKQLENIKKITDSYKEVFNEGRSETQKLKIKLEEKKKEMLKLTSEHANVEQNVNKLKDDMEKLNSQMPQWEENKKKAVEGKNFAIAGKMSTQIKTAQSQIDEMSKKLEEMSENTQNFDSIKSNLNSEMEEIQNTIDYEESNKDKVVVGQLEQLCKDVKKSKFLLNKYLNISENVKLSYGSLYDKFFELFFSEYTRKLAACNMPPVEGSIFDDEVYVGSETAPEPVELTEEVKNEIIDSKKKS